MLRNPDEKDVLLIEALRANSRTPLKTLAGKIGLSISSTQERIARLERDGVIAGYTIRLNQDQLHNAYMLVTTEASQCAEIAPQIEHIAEIVRCDSVAGEIDLVLTLEVLDPGRLQAIRDEISALTGVRSVVTLPRMIERFAR